MKNFTAAVAATALLACSFGLTTAASAASTTTDPYKLQKSTGGAPDKYKSSTSSTYTQQQYGTYEWNQESQTYDYTPGDTVRIKSKSSYSTNTKVVKPQ